MMTITYTVNDGLYINMTNRCPNRCEFCVRTSGDKPYGDLWLQHEPTIEEIWEDIRRRDLTQYSELVFCGFGEPTERLYDILEVCRKIRATSKIKIRLNTNGLSDLIWKKNTAPDYNGLFDIVSISLNYANADDYDRVCHPVFGKAAYDAIIAFAANVKHYVGEVVMTVVDTTIPPEDIETCRKITEKIGVKFRVREFIN